ncbi:hypothetical protein C8A01DRAFT_21397 [Parachaetomium inaequale]|uniref:Uncharacterized protein n=1 Tax=Parachaetomium inaequale TaxID=2588326 RepID=A0AAN6P8E5_9PEZI|nr:hypothetical protein C8A01DRAFT_21397 [Parachaetomium inaequale]
MWSPLGYESVNNTARWHAEPTIRGTFSILSTCLFTLSICTWTAVHLNVPGHGKAGTPHVWRKVKWVAIGMMAPEAVRSSVPQVRSGFRKKDVPLIIRSNQQDDAVVEMESPAPQPADNSRRRRHRWTKTHTYYALMGGFVFQNAGQERLDFEIKLPENREQLTLTVNAVRFLASQEPNLLPDLSEAYIKDKGKTNWLAKSIVLGQALWFCLQFVTRLAQGLPTTLLELNTFAHVFYAFIVYIIWWNKPLDIGEPTEIGIEEEQTRDLCAAMCVNSHIGRAAPCVDSPRKAALEVAIDDDNPEAQGSAPISPQETVIGIGGQEKGIIFRRVYSALPTTLLASRLDGGGGFTTVLENSPGLQVKVSTNTVFLFAAARRGYAKYPQFRGQSQTVTPPEYVDIRSYNYRSVEVSAEKDLALFFGFLLLGCVYGGIHLLAWDGPFRTRAELILWRTSSIAITGPLGYIGLTPVLMLITVPIVCAYQLIVALECRSEARKEPIRQKFRQLKEKARTEGGMKVLSIAYWVLMAPFMVFFWVYFVVYLFARVYVVVECYIVARGRLHNIL